MLNHAESGVILWPSVDLGGTSIRLLLVAVQAGRPAAVIRAGSPAPKGIPTIVETLDGLLREVSDEATSRGMTVAPVLAIGAPGRIETTPSGSRFIAPRTAACLEAFHGELDGVDLARELALGLKLDEGRVFWENDAVVQGRHLIGGLLDDPDSAEAVRGHVAVCINPGTGLGGCVAEVGADDIEVFTDGHISELLIHPVETDRDLGELAATIRSSADGASIGVELRTGETVVSREIASPEFKQAEDLFSGEGLALIADGFEDAWDELDLGEPCFGSRTGRVDGRLLSEFIAGGGDCVSSRAARFIGDFGGSALARLMTVLNEGRAVKTAPYPNWSRDDLERLRGVNRFILGGGISATPLGERMAATARLCLAHWPELHLFDREPAADAGALGAFSLIPEATRRAIEADSDRPHPPWVKSTSP